MRWRERIDRVLGRQTAPDAALAADRARQRQMHGQETEQTDQEQAAVRQRMEADMDTQRVQRAAPTDPET